MPKKEVRHPRLDIDPVELRRLYVDEMWCLDQLCERFRTNDANIRATLDHHGIPRRHKRGPRSPQHHGSWKGGRHVDKDGYVYLRTPDHPYANHAGYVREHRLVMEKEIGRYLEPHEVVHHKKKNGPKDDNRIENLQLYDSNAEHLADELKGHCPQWTKEGRARMDAATAKKRKTIPADVDLHDLYWVKKLSADAIGQMLGLSESRILDEFDRRGIPKKTGSQAQSTLKLPPDDELKLMLQSLSTPIVAERLGVKAGSLYAYLSRRGIPTSRKQGVQPEHSRPGYSPKNRSPKEPDAPSSPESSGHSTDETPTVPQSLSRTDGMLF